MKKLYLKFLLIFFILGIVGLLVFSYSSMHLRRNEHNLLPKGKLKFVGNLEFIDEEKSIWLLQPHSMNIYHQTKVPYAQKHDYAYVILDTIIEINPDYPNLKFLHLLSSGASCEAILQPNGEYLTTGVKQGTYNYAHPDGFLGKFWHFIFDMLPGFINSNYEDIKVQ